jgi:hypothetical protein
MWRRAVAGIHTEGERMGRRRRWFAVVAAVVLVAGCSDPMGAARRLASQSASRSPSASAKATSHGRHRVRHWRQRLHSTVFNKGLDLRVRASGLHGDRALITITDVKTKAVKRVHADVTPQSVVVGRYSIKSLVISGNAVTFAYTLR